MKKIAMFEKVSYNEFLTACATSMVVALPPKSPVKVLPSLNTFFTCLYLA